MIAEPPFPCERREREVRWQTGLYWGRRRTGPPRRPVRGREHSPRLVTIRP